MALTNTALAQLLSDTADGWQAFVTSVKAWGTDQVNTVTFEDPLGGPDLVFDTLYKVKGDYAALTGSEWAITVEDTLVPSGNLVDEYSALHWAKKAQLAAAGVVSVQQEVIDSQAAAAESREWAMTVENTLVPSGDMIDDYSSLHHAAKSAASAASGSASASQADTAKTAAELAETNAGASATAAALSDASAGISETNAGASETSAGTSATNAAASEAKAADWAEELEDVTVEVGKYSALHHAAKAAASATVASTSETNADTSATTANTAKVAAQTAKTAAELAETNAGSSATAASTSAAAALVSETNAAASAAAATNDFDTLTDVDITGRLDGWVAYFDLAADKIKFKAAGSGGGAVDSVAGKTGIVTLVEADITDLQSYSLASHNHTGTYEPVITQNTGFNLVLGTLAGQVAEGNHSHSAYATTGHNHTGVYEPADVTILKDADIGVTVQAAGSYAASSHNHTGVYEPVFNKNTGFNLALGVSAGQVAEGNHNHNAAYATVSHDHDASYAALSHNHTLADVTDSGALAALNTVGTAQIDNSAVTLGKLANMATASLLGRNTAAVGVPEVLTPAQVRTILNVEDGATAGGGAAPVGKQTIWIPATAMTGAKTDGAVAGQVEMVTANTTDIVSLDFDAATKQFALFNIAMPKQWDEGGVSFKVFWSAGDNSPFGVVWGLSALVVGNGDDIDSATNDFSTTRTVNATVSGGTDLFSISPEGTNVSPTNTPVAGELMFFRLERDVTDGFDTNTSAARMIGMQLFWTNNTTVDD